MRSDMHEVIIERPRWAHAARYPRAFARQRYRFRNDAEKARHDAPLTERMGAGYGDKHLNENLAPLVRFLRSRVGRPWSKVRSEMAEHLRVTSAVQKHVMDHVKQYVTTETWLGADGRIWGAEWRSGRPTPITPSTRPDFYVHPSTGLLLMAPIVARKKKRKPPRAEPHVRRLSPTRQLRRIDGVWYEVELRPFPERAPNGRSGPRVWDVVADCLTRRYEGSYYDPSPMRREWWDGHYAFAKRQLGKREIKKLLVE